MTSLDQHSFPMWRTALTILREPGGKIYPNIIEIVYLGVKKKRDQDKINFYCNHLFLGFVKTVSSHCLSLGGSGGQVQ